MKKKHLKFLKQLVETPSPTGFEEPAASLVRERLADVADEVATDTMGSVRAVLEGREAFQQKRLGVDGPHAPHDPAHTDPPLPKARRTGRRAATSRV